MKQQQIFRFRSMVIINWTKVFCENKNRLNVIRNMDNNLYFMFKHTEKLYNFIEINLIQYILFQWF